MQRQANAQRIQFNSPTQRDIGMCGLSLVLAIKAIDLNPGWAIDQANKDLTDLTHFSEPERNHMINVVLSCLDERDRENLSLHKDRFLAFVVEGKILPLPIEVSAIQPSPFEALGHTSSVQLCIAL